ncbi:MAG: hypothetical protein WCK39_00970 [Methanomassiliicoccales archaeon]
MDKPQMIFDTVLALVNEEKAEGHIFDKMEIYEDLPRLDVLRFPCIVMSKSVDQRVQRYLGGGELRGMSVSVQVAFMEKFSGPDDDGNLQAMEKLATVYRQRLDALLDRLVFAPILDVGEFEHKVNLQLPSGSGNVWGAEASLVLTFGSD